jgi:hypothetical protein
MDGSVAHRRRRDRHTASASQVSRDLSVRIPRLDSYLERYPKRHPGNGNVWGSNPARHGDAVAALAVDHVLAADDTQSSAAVLSSRLVPRS